ncbi:tail fiber domain-containing protein [Candidatus Parcubacteria bacterium]|nr:tail fiber domain-containing protein [Candidatus Parcubacteria bacterium]
MDHDLLVEGEKYISARRAAKEVGYADDYIGQLCRSGALNCKMVGRSWHVTRESVHNHVSRNNPHKIKKPEVVSKIEPAETFSRLPELRKSQSRVSFGRTLGINAAITVSGLVMASHAAGMWLPEISPDISNSLNMRIAEIFDRGEASNFASVNLVEDISAGWGNLRKFISGRFLPSSNQSSNVADALAPSPLENNVSTSTLIDLVKIKNDLRSELLNFAKTQVNYVSEYTYNGQLVNLEQVSQTRAVRRVYETISLQSERNVGSFSTAVGVITESGDLLNTRISNALISGSIFSGPEGNFVNSFFENASGTSATTTNLFSSLLSVGNGSLSIGASGLVGIGTTTPQVALHVGGTGAIGLPYGTTAERPTGLRGLLRFNTSTNSFEGNNGSVWSGIGGVIDIDQNTYILAESSSGANEDTLFFNTGGSERMRLDSAGRLGIGTTTPKWLLQLASSTAPQLTLSDPSSILNNHWSFRNSGGNFYLATSSPSTFATSSIFALAINGVTGNISIGSTTSFSGEKLEVIGNIISKGTQWTSRTSATDNSWHNVAYGNGLFVAVAQSGSNIMTSPDGINWTTRTAAAANSWRSVVYANGLFVAVSSSVGGGSLLDHVMTSPDGINWTLRSGAVANQWRSITYGNGLFVAVAISGTGNRVQTSPDGINWTSRTSAADNDWHSVTYGNGLFVAVASTGSGNRVMTSPDGITWTTRTSASNNNWKSVTYGNGLFVAVAISGTGDRVMTSPDGITWTTRSSAADNDWQGITYGNGLFVAVAITGTGNRVMTSPDGINWTSRTSAANNDWESVVYGNGIFVAVSDTGTGNRVMTSGKPDTSSTQNNNIFQGVTAFMQNVGFGTTTPRWPVQITASGTPNLTLSDALSLSSNHWSFRNAGGNLYIATSSPTTFATSTTAVLTINGTSGYLGVSSTSPNAPLSVSGISYFGGNVGVGILSPEANLDVLSTSITSVPGVQITIASNSTTINATNQGALRLTNTNSTDNNYANILFGTQSGVIPTAGIYGVFTNRGSNFGDLAFLTRSASGYTEKFRVSSIGVGIGTTTPQWALQVASSTGAQLTLSDSSSLSNSHWSFRNAGGNFYLATSSPTTFATSTYTTLSINSVTGNIGLGLVSTSTGERLEVLGNIISKGTEWTTRTTVSNSWQAVTYGNGLFVAVSDAGTGNRVMTSPDGINWTARTNAADNNWQDVTYGNGLFVAVANTGTGNRIMTSPDGINWTARSSVADNDWRSVTYGNGTFVAVAQTGTNRVMTSPDGINWTARSASTANSWFGVTYGNGQFVAVSVSGNTTGVMTSPDGVTWTTRTTPAAAWRSIAYGNGVYVSVSNNVGQVMSSFDGITWTSRVTAQSGNAMEAVTYGNGLFVVVASSGVSGIRVMTSPDGINWTSRASASDNSWQSVTYGNGIFVAVSNTSSGSDVMTSGKPDTSSIQNNNFHQGTTAFMGFTGFGTTTPQWPVQISSSSTPNLVLSDALSLSSNHWSFRNAGGNFYLATSSPSTFATSTTAAFSILSNGNIGISSSTPMARLSVVSSAAEVLALSGTSNGVGLSFYDDIGGGSVRNWAIINDKVGAGRLDFAVSAASGGSPYAANTTKLYLDKTGEVGITGFLTIGIGSTGNIFTSDLAGHIGIGTTTPQWLLQLATSTAPQLTLSDPSSLTNNHWSLRNAAGRFYLATSSPTTFATSTVASFSIDQNGKVFLNSGLGTGAGGNYLCIDTTTYEVLRGNGVSCTASSQRFKENIQDLGYGLNEILALRPVSYTYKPGTNMGEGTKLGFIAEEVQTILPEVVTLDNQGQVFGLDYPVFTSVLTKAIQELNQKVIAVELNLASASTSLAISTSTPGFAASVLEALGATVQDAVLYIKHLVVDTLTAKDGVVIYDRVTGQPVCTVSENGVLKSYPGDCSVLPPVPIPAYTPPPPDPSASTTPPDDSSATTTPPATPPDEPTATSTEP